MAIGSARSCSALMLRALMLALAVAHSAACSRHSSCSGDRYCDSSHNCYDCDFVRSSSCDAYNGDCSVCGVSSSSSSSYSPYSSYSSGGTNMYTGLEISVGLFFIGIGTMMALFGYKLWKYTAFILGFLIVGAIGAGVAVILSASADMSNGDTFEMHGGAAVGGFLVGGLFGGFCFLGCYILVIFCTGCGFGMTSFWLIVVAIFASTNSASSFASTLMGMDRDTVNVLSILDLLFGIFMGCVFWKFQKVCIMLGTSFLGSSWFWCGISLLFQAPALYLGGLNTVLVYLSAAGAFCVQWFHTSKGVEIDPKTGQVVVITAQPVHPIGHEPPLLAAAQPTTAYIGAPYK